MFSDTHFHFNSLEESENFTRADILQKMAENDVFFGLDIGTHCDDLQSRQILMQNSINKIQDKVLQQKIMSMIYFSVGIWPAPEAIKSRRVQVEQLENQLKNALNSDNNFCKKVCAIGECGLDHHWNPSGVDCRSENDFNDELFLGERELFEMQLLLAKKYNLPVIVHSRDAFDGTLECIKNIGYDNGIIHCYSYGLDEARAFLNRGWYFAFGGGVTYTKKSKMLEMTELLKYIPTERLLLETDAPYLAPVPFRGQKNNPLLIEHSYNFIANIRGISVENLSNFVDENIKKLFKIN